MTLTTTLPKAWNAFITNKRYVLLTILFEFIFLFVVTQIHLSLFIPAAGALDNVGKIISAEMEKLPETEVYQLDTVLRQNPEFTTQYQLLLTYLIFFVLSMLAAWIIFKSPVWYLSHKTILKKMPLGTHLLKFTLLSLFWFAIIITALVIYGAMAENANTLLPSATSIATTIITYLIFLAIFYFAQISFAIIPAQQTFKNTFNYGIHHTKTILPAFIVNALITFIVLTLPFNWIETQPLISLAIIVIITIPALAFARLHMIVATWSKHS